MQTLKCFLLFSLHSPELTWRDVQYLLIYTSNPDLLMDDGGWAMNDAGLRFHLQYGFGAVDTEAIVTRARYWENVPDQMNKTVVPEENAG